MTTMRGSAPQGPAPTPSVSWWGNLFPRLRNLAIVLLMAIAVLVCGSKSGLAISDIDNDGFSDSLETAMGTDPAAACNSTTSPNDEAIDAWPSDFNDDTKVDITDVVLFRSAFGLSTGQAGFSPRYDFNLDGKIDIMDVARLRTDFGKTCTPNGAGTRIRWQGQDWYLLGANLPWYNWQCDFGCGTSSGVSNSGVKADIAAKFAQLQAAGVHTVRWWVFPGDPWQITRNAQGAPTGLNSAIWADFDAALQLANQYDIYFSFTLFSGPTDLPGSWIDNATQRGQLAGVLGQLFAHYSGNQRIISWEIFNEPEFAMWNNQVSTPNMQATVGAIAASVHANSTALVSVGSAMLDGLSFWTGLGLDYYTAHWYDYMSSGNWCARCTDYTTVKSQYNLDKPLVIGEFYAGTDTDAYQRLADFYAKGYAGAWPWSLFPDHTSDGMNVDMSAAQTFASQHSDVGP